MGAPTPPSASDDEAASAHHGRHRAEDRADERAGEADDEGTTRRPVDSLLEAHSFSRRTMPA